MTKKPIALSLSLAAFSLLFLVTAVAKPIDYYLPDGERFNSSIPSPATMLNQDLGDRHLRHDQIVRYMGMLAASSPQAKLIEYGRTHEGRRLVLLAITSAENINQFEDLPKRNDILKIWQGFSIHGNEPSGANAAVLYAWYVLATDNKQIRDALNDTVILIDPTINPDGFDRFATYVNSFRSKSTVSDPNDMSHNEQWPSGRTNHYWFDLNRDWLLLTQPESQARITQFQKWQPHLVTDHHEMGTAGSFFFQPGVPSRKNPLIVSNNVTLTEKLAHYHAKGLDKLGERYYSRESFDDFYPGKGSTYPDLQGSVGILFEQARAEGGVIEGSNGERSLAAGIRNHFTTALSTLIGADELRDEFMAHKRTFNEKARQAAAKLDMNGFVIDVSKHPQRGIKLLDFLNRHQIKAENVAENKTINDHKFSKDKAIYVSLDQPQTILIQALFATDKRFEDNTFYDVSAWNLPMAWGLPFAAVNGSLASNDKFGSQKVNNVYNKAAVAFAFSWDSEQAPAALNYLLQNQQTVFISAKPLNIDGASLPAGSFVLTVSDHQSEDDVFSLLSNISDQFAVEWHSLTTFQADSGIDAGSPQLQQLKTPKVLMVVGSGINAYQAGSIWHLFDTQVHMPLTKVRINDLSSIALNHYSHIILPDGRYNKTFNKGNGQRLKDWVKQGGHLISLQHAALWVDKQFADSKADSKSEGKDTAKGPEASADKNDTNDNKSEQVFKKYADYEQDSPKRILGGAIVAATADLSHPLAFGTQEIQQYPLMKGDAVLNEPKSPYATPLRLNKAVEAAGYVSDYWQQKLQQKPLVTDTRMGRGSVIHFGFNPNFRGFWYGTQRWLINAIYLADLVRSTDLD